MSVTTSHDLAQVTTIGLCLLACVLAPAPPVLSQEKEDRSLSLMPLPQSVRVIGGAFSLTEEIPIALSGPADERLDRAVDRFASRLAARTSTDVRMEIVPDPRHARMVVEWTALLGGPYPSLEDDESYRLSVTAERVTLSSPGPLGVLRGLATLAQLPERHGDRWVLPAVEIDDEPRFPWRGLMIDVVRHWQPVEVIERNLDAMEAVKLNVLHLHLTDDQGFRVESRTHPLLHEKGSGGDYFSQADVRHIVSYAADRGIRVVPEFDVPGHATSWLVAYPNLGSPAAEPPEEVPSRLGMFHNALDPSRETTYTFLDGLLAEMAGLFPDRYVHVGGDEVAAESWREDPAIQSFMTEEGIGDTRGLQAHFTGRILEMVARHGKIGVGWDEIARAPIPEGAVIQLWLPGADPGTSPSLVSNGFYLDHMLHAGRHYANEPLDVLPEGAAPERLLGGEACVWTETITSDTIDSRIWPRTAAIAERLWSARDADDTADMYRRLEAIRSHLTAMGLRHDTYYEPAVARLAGGTLPKPLQVLADATEAPSILGRMLAPEMFGAILAPKVTEWLVDPVEIGTRFEHVLQPESEVGRAFTLAVTDLLESRDSGEARATVEDQLRLWQGNHETLRPILEERPALQEIAPVSEALAELAKLGLESLQVLDGERLFTAREKRLHDARLALLAPMVMDLEALDLDPDADFAEVMPGLIAGMVTDRLKTLQPLITFRVSQAAQPGVLALVRAAHEQGTREEGVVARAGWLFVDHRGKLVALLALGALVALVVRRRRRRKAA